MPELDANQAALVGGIGDAFRAGARCVVAVAPTGAGKTVMFAETTRRYAERGRRVLILAHRESLVRQAANKLRDVGVPHALIRPGVRTLAGSRVRVGMVGTVSRRVPKPDADAGLLSPTLQSDDAGGYDLIHVDEGHHATEGSAYAKILNNNPQARVIKWTASPERLDGMGLGRGFGGMADALVEGPSVADLMDGGFLVRASVFGPNPTCVADLSGVKTNASGEMIADAQAEILNQPKITGDAVAHYRNLCPGTPAVVFCCNVKHAEEVAAAFRADGWSAAAVYGAMSGDPNKVISKLGTGDLHVITSCDLIGEGLDLPAITTVIKLRQTASLSLNVQWDGRPLRPLPGTRGSLAAIAASAKPRAFILDHAGNVWRHGWPQTPRIWTLEGRRKRPKDATHEPRQCPACFCMCPAAALVCDECKHSFAQAKVLDEKPKPSLTPEQGELQALDPNRFEHLRETPLAKLLPKARTLDALKEIEIAKNYKSGWAEKQKSFKEAAYIRHRWGDR